MSAAGAATGRIFAGTSDALCRPQLIRLRPDLVAASFQLMKIVPAKYIVERALERGEIDPAYPVVESSSGSFALGLGIVCAEKRLSFHIVSDAAIDARLERRLQQLGGKVQIVGSRAGTERNIQVLRLEALQERLRRQAGSFWTRQYDNPDNQRAYRGFARQLLDAFGSELVIVGTVGSGGSTCGTIKALREHAPSTRLVGVDTFGSVLFGLPAARRELRGLGNAIMPGNLDHSCFDEVHWVCARDAHRHTRLLHREFGLFCGPTSGAAFQVARALEAPGKTVVFIAPDDGHRYIDTVYADRESTTELATGPEPAAIPRRVARPDQAVEPWSYLEWNRRALSEVTGCADRPKLAMQDAGGGAPPR